MNSARQTVTRPAGKRVALVLAAGQYPTFRCLTTPCVMQKPSPSFSGKAVSKFTCTSISPEPRCWMRWRNSSKKRKERARRWPISRVTAWSLAVGMSLLRKTRRSRASRTRFRRVVDLNALFDAVSVADRRIVLLDACRNDPFPGCSRAGGGGGGFRSFSDIRAGGMLLANSTLAGALARDGDKGDHSPFAKSLLKRLTEAPSSYFRDVLETVAADVAQETGNQQIPEVITRGAAPRDCLQGMRCGDDPKTSSAR